MGRSREGFTLVELAIVLVLVGLLLGLGAGLIGPLTKRAKYAESKEEVRKAIEALKGFVIRCGCLPPARPPDNYNPSVPDPAFTTLGVKGLDAHGRALLYIPASETIPQGNGDSCGDCTDLSPPICSINGTSLSLVLETGSANQTISNLAFVVVSGGPNHNIQTNSTVYIQGKDNVDDFDHDFKREEEYDDIVEYISIYEILQQRCYYSIPSPIPSPSCTSLEVELGSGINSYRKSGGSCNTGNANVIVSLSQSDYIATYIGNNCNNQNLCGNFTFSNLMAVDADRDCMVKIEKTGNYCSAGDK